MSVPVIMPKLEMAQETATIVEWLVAEGGPVQKGAPLLTVETDKVTVDVEAPASGTLSSVRYQAQDVVPVTEVIAHILAPDEEPDAQDLSQARAPDRAYTAEVGTPAKAPPDATPVARRLAAAHGLDLEGVQGSGPSGRGNRRVRTRRVRTRADVERALSAAATIPSEPEPSLPPGKVRATPAARRIARERAIELGRVTGTGPRGRIQVEDVRGVAPAETFGGIRVARVEPLQGIRRTIAERMTASYQAAPHIYLTVRVDMQALQDERARLNVQAAASGLAHISVTAMLVRATALALRRHPMLNSVLRNEDVLLLDEVNVGVAVALESGLIVPVVRDADRMSLQEIAGQVNDLAKRAREGQLKPGDVSGGTFTLSNLGPFGVEQFTGIINPPQTALLAVGATQQEVVVGEGGGLFVRPVMRMTLSADHRVVDGAQAARFLRDLSEVLQGPQSLVVA